MDNIFPKNATYLEPYYNQRQLEQHLIHHIKYLMNMDKAQKSVDEALQQGNFYQAEEAGDAMLFNKNGAYLHSLFWASLANNQEVPPEVERIISKDFESFDNFRQLFLQKANSLKGSGWLVIAYCPQKDLILLQELENQNSLTTGLVPLIDLDLWEHAYYLQYLDKRDDWSRTFFDKLINWKHFLKVYGEKRIQEYVV